MNTKLTYGFFLTFLVLIAGLGVYTIRKGTFDNTYLLAKARAQKVKADDITSVVIERTEPSAETITFEREGKAWKLTEPIAARADRVTIDQLIGDLLALRPDDKPGSSDRNLALHGLDKPSLTVILKKGDSTVGSVRLGALALGESGGTIYVNSSDRSDRAFLVARNRFDGLFGRDSEGTTAGELLRPINDWRSKDLLAAGVFNPAESVQSITVREGKNDPVVLTQGSDKVWRFEKPANFGVADLEGDSSTSMAPPGTPPTGVKPLLNTLSGLRVGSSDDFLDDGKSLADYGLDEANAERLHIEIIRKPQAADGDTDKPITEGLTVGKKADEMGEKFYAQLDGAKSVVKVSARAIDPFRQLAKKPSALRDRSLITKAQQPEIDAIDLKIGSDKPVLLRKSGEPANWQLYDAAGNALTARNAAVADLLNALSEPRLIADFPEGKTDADLGFEQPQAVVDLWEQGIDSSAKPAETKADDAKKDEAKPALPKLKSSKPSIQLVFGRKDKDVIYVRRLVGSVKSDVAVPTRTLSAISKGRIDFIDTKLPAFSPEDAEKLLILRGTVTEYELAKADGKWVIKQPASLAGRPADPDKVRLILDEFGRMQAVKLVAESGTAAELDRWGLKPPLITVTVTIKDGKPATRTYQLGKESDDKAGFYTKLGEQDVVFLASKTVVDRLNAGDLQDPTVFQFDLGAVTGLKLAGWEDLGTGLVTLNLARKKPGDWSFRDKGPFETIDPEKAEGFVAGLIGLRAEAFVNHTGEIKPDYKLSPKDGALTVELEQEGVKEPFQLTVGGPDPTGRFYYATSKQLPKDVFLVPQDRFKDARAKPAYFKK